MKRDTGLIDTNDVRIHEGDKVSFCGHTGIVVFECGAFGVAVDKGIEYIEIQRFMDEEADICCGNEYSGCENDNFISLWEIYSNFNCEEDYLWILEVIQ